MFTKPDTTDLGVIGLVLVTAAAVITLTVILVIAIAEPKPYFPNQRTSLPSAVRSAPAI